MERRGGPVDPSAATVEVTPRDIAAISPKPAIPVGADKPAHAEPALETVEIAPGSVRAKVPPPVPPGGRIDRAALRFVFGTLALIVLAFFIISWLNS